MPNTTALLAFSLSSLLLFTGFLSIGFTYVIYPFLVPGYGGGEPFLLTSYNNYTDTYPWFSSSKLHLTIKANDTIQINIDGENVYNGTYYKISIEPNENTLITLKSSSPVTGRFEAWQEPPWMMQLSVIGIFFAGLITTGLSFAYWIRVGKSENRKKAS
ncbi:MAG: hypothetical protein ACFFB5_15345 [Promethearchaeota archaeon]